MKTAKKENVNGNSKTYHPAEQAVLNKALEFSYQARANRPLSLAAIFNTMRILKAVNKGDCYLENYTSMQKRYGEDFFDTYQVLWAIGVYRSPKRILEIGTRTGISLCQLLSVHSDLSNIQHIVCVDPFDQWTSPNLVRANLAYLGLPSSGVDILPIKSEDYFKQSAENASVGTFDYILVDGDHTKAVAAEDLKCAHGLIETGGIIVFDDISTAPGECALIDVWEAWKKDHLADYDFYECMDGKGVAFAIRK